MLFFTYQFSKSQIAGEPKPEFNPDTVFIFKSPRPLLPESEEIVQYKNSFRFDAIISEHGIGIGFLYSFALTKDLHFFSNLYISGARNTDEFEYYYWDPETGSWILRVPNKVNRLYMFPLNFGVEQYLFTNFLSESLKPFISAGIGPTLIVSTPYDREFFNSLGYARGYIRFSAFAGFGANFSINNKNFLGVSFKYYYIPFGGDGLESIKNMPIKDFGGIFLSLSIGVWN